MKEFWESNFQNKQTMWGAQPADATLEVKALFQKNNINKILIPGFGYGRNAKTFIDSGFDVTGIEISKTAIDLAKEHLKGNYKLYHGSIADMPFDKENYNGIFCYALIHLLNKNERKKLIQDCYDQLEKNGIMIFISLSTNDSRFGKGEKISNNTYLTKHDIELFFYDSDTLEREFRACGLVEAEEINEPVKIISDKPSQKFWKIICKKDE
ncbi:class I SAM-dependent methyltransferase [Aquimarina muelleri]|uniref:Methyltransferase n=1 Tax=Aquimarina muelleri TaxID=279356 RepID=A0A918JWU7_9FLAO|nr:class I SAM-dependent methyltransferase [Aquimarina muelleri]MCX2763641.1 class I SAM-dependent methyltransferase [Aquimarina muelleri]GGX26759.1 methyltransferase [Aquimarina muelleri]